jgi:hypothetical protein
MSTVCPARQAHRRQAIGDSVAGDMDVVTRGWVVARDPFAPPADPAGRGPAPHAAARMTTHALRTSNGSRGRCTEPNRAPTGARPLTFIFCPWGTFASPITSEHRSHGDGGRCPTEFARNGSTGRSAAISAQTLHGLAGADPHKTDRPIVCLMHLVHRPEDCAAIDPHRPPLDLRVRLRPQEPGGCASSPATSGRLQIMVGLGKARRSRVGGSGWRPR